jgi:arylsulfatase A-like enzyme
MIRRSTLVALARIANLSFFLATSLYCLLTYNAFAFQQFIRPHLISALTNFAEWHGELYWIVLLTTALTLLPPARRADQRRAVAVFFVVSAGIGCWLIGAQVLPQVENSQRSLVLALLALVPPIWLAVIDHRTVAVGPIEPSDPWRLMKSGLIAAMVVVAAYAAAAPFRPRPAGGVAMRVADLALGMSSSTIAHLTVFVMIVLIATTLREVASVTRSRGRREYGLLVVAATLGMTFVVRWIIFAPIAFTGPQAWAVAAVAGTAVALTWSSIARHRSGDAPTPRPTAMDAFLAPIASSGSRPLSLAGVAVIVAGAVVLTRQAAGFDWNFMVQKLIVVAVWVTIFGFVHAAVVPAAGGSRPAFRGGVALPFAILVIYGAETAALARVPAWLNDPRMQPDFVLDAYATVDPSYKLIRDAFTTDPGADPAFFAYLRANSTIHASVPVEPVDIDFVRPLGPVSGYRPHIFFFLIDSLRPDYVSAYNRAVNFTPRIGEFAREAGSYVFAHAFTRYGGTGLSVPAIWAGGMVLHKEYVTPFARMNTLEKLLFQNRYQWLITKDHITDLLTPSPHIEWLDRDVPEMDHTFCGTMQELGSRVRVRAASAPPIFAHTRPLDLHVSKIRGGSAPKGESYPGFNGAYAARVHRIDACFGELVDVLKDTGLYDDSVIVVMSDHGDSLGEEQRWGHAYTLFPEVIRIPLIVHLPRRLVGEVAADLGRVSFSTDVTPTLYRLLGYQAADLGPLFGQPLFDAPGIDRSRRRRQSTLLASSYGPVYAVLSQNGRKLYIADAVNERDYAYEVTADVLGRRVGVSDADRLEQRKLIRAGIAQLADEYRFNPQP